MEKEIIYNAFPAILRQDVERVVEILSFEHNVLLADGQIHNVNCLVHSNEQIIILDKELLKIPCRIYFNEPASVHEKVLTGVQTTILNCIYLRHHNGFVRQRRLEQLVDKTEYFVTPFTFQLLGEYVIEILEVLQKHISPTTIDNYLKFINENQLYWTQTQSRMVSYWNEYYRRPMYPHYLSPKYATRKEYIGQQIIDRLKKRTYSNSIGNGIS